MPACAAGDHAAPVGAEGPAVALEGGELVALEVPDLHRLAVFPRQEPCAVRREGHASDRPLLRLDDPELAPILRTHELDGPVARRGGQHVAVGVERDFGDVVLVATECLLEVGLDERPAQGVPRSGVSSLSKASRPSRMLSSGSIWSCDVAAAASCRDCARSRWAIASLRCTSAKAARAAETSTATSAAPRQDAEPARLGSAARDDELGLQRRGQRLEALALTGEPVLGRAQFRSPEQVGALAVVRLPSKRPREPLRVLPHPLVVGADRLGDVRGRLLGPAPVRVDVLHRRQTGRTPSAGRRSTGTRRFPSSSARDSSLPHSGEATDSGLMTKTKASAASIPEPSSSRQGAPAGMSSASTQTTWPPPSSALFSREDELRVPVGVGDEGVEAAVVPAAELPAVYQGAFTAVPLWKCRAV